MTMETWSTIVWDVEIGAGNPLDSGAARLAAATPQAIRRHGSAATSHGSAQSGQQSCIASAATAGASANVAETGTRMVDVSAAMLARSGKAIDTAIRIARAVRNQAIRAL